MSAAKKTQHRRAQILTPELLNHLLHVVQATSLDPLRDYAAILLSFKGGLRACEIVGLSWTDVTGPRGEIGQPKRNPVTGEIEPYFEVPNGIAKNGRGRSIPMHPALQATLEHLQKALGPARAAPRDPVIQSRGPAAKLSLKPLRLKSNALVVFLSDLYEKAGLVGCSSHSGRRTAITKLAQTANTHGCSLFDVQRFAGHADIGTTESYVEASPHAGKMVRAL